LTKEWSDKIIAAICAKIHSKGLDIRQEFQSIDEDNSGKVSQY
jgi:hypothetical protein